MTDTPWYYGGVIYQIYPWSFQDTSGNGIGDLNGIIERLDYLEWLGIDAIWLSPIFQSPMIDFGYDISDYLSIDPLFGTMTDFDTLLDEAHQHNIRVILDLVPNHTSDQHPWFIESRSSRDNPKRDWYMWYDAQPDGSPPNNWRSEFGGSAWQWDDHTQQYYLHTFAVAQPELNWRNPDVVNAMLDVVRFWLDKGIDGFRVDVIHQLIKDQALRDDPLNPHFDPETDNPYDEFVHRYSSYQPEVHEFVRQFRELFDNYDDTVFIGEIHYSAPLDDMKAFYGQDDQLHLPFNFWLTEFDFEPAQLQDFVNTYDNHVPDFGFPNYVLGNHDVPRIASRIGDEKSRLAGMLLLTLRGTAFLYYGDELGIHDIDIDDTQLNDIRGLNVSGHSRDPARSPMQWSSHANAGFSAISPWLPLTTDYKIRNVSSLMTDQQSILHLYRHLIHLRKRCPALQHGRYEMLTSKHAPCWIFRREAQDEQIIVALNFSNEEITIDLTDLGTASLILSTYLDRWNDTVSDNLTLRPYEGCIIASENKQP